METDLTIFRACADATRLRILYILCEGELCVCELVDVLQMAQGKVSRHLAQLRQAGLVRDRREGVWIHYSLAPAKVPLLRRLFAYLRSTREEAGARDLQRLRERTSSGDLCAPRIRRAEAAG
ncbi:ArsR/SmtB family transcription factor [Candidatus Latescibacterota bacterium]